MDAKSRIDALFDRVVSGLDLGARHDELAPLREALAGADLHATARLNPLLSMSDLPAEGATGGTAVRRAEIAAMPFDVGPLVHPWRGMQPAQTLGPFVDRTGRTVHFELYGPTHAIRFVSAGTPVLVSTAARFPRLSHAAATVTLDLQRGTIWIPATLLAPSAPAGFLGLRVQDGKVTIPSGAVESGGVVDIGLNANFTADLEVAPASQPPVAADGCAASATTTVTGPSHVRLEVHDGHLQRLVIGPGAASAYGRTYTFAEHNGPGHFVPEIASVLFDAAVIPSVFDLADVSSSLLDGTGQAPITASGWAFPLTQASAGQLGEASGSGAWAMGFGPGAVGHVTAGDPNELPLASGWILIAPGSFALKARIAPTIHTERKLALWARSGPQAHLLPFRIRHPKDALAAYVCDTHGEHVFVTGLAHLAVDQPVQASGRPVGIADGGVVLSIARESGTRKVTVYGWPGTGLDFQPTGNTPAPDNVLAARNALLWVSAPRLFLLTGDLSDDDSIRRGSLVLVFGLQRWAPTLPDPYVASFTIAGKREEGGRIIGLLLATVDWVEGAAAVLAFEGRLPQPDVTPRPATTDSSRPHPPDPQDVHPSVQPAGSAAPVEITAKEAMSAARVDRAATEAVTRVAAGTRLLDVSTCKDLIGVEWTLDRQRMVTAVAEGAGAATVASLPLLWGMDVQLPLAQQRVFMLPQMQWEPVRTLPEDQDPVTLGWFPTPLASTSDGGATRLVAESPTLAPAIPDLVVDGVLDAFAGGSRTLFATTLPFGIQAIVRLRATASGAFHRDALRRTEPMFAAPALKGGAQITALAEGGREKPGDESPGFEGFTVQRKNAVDLVTGAALGLSVLGATLDPAGSVESVFNEEFTSAAPRVPVTRFDLSGYGGSNFSDWSNPFGAFAQTTKVQFKVIVGRTFWEMVKVATVLYPWGIRVTRSVTIERTAGAGVIRKDSGWQASSDGLFDFRYKPDAVTPPQPSPYVVHPGLLRGLFHVVRIRPTNGPIVEFPGTSGPVHLSPQYFDAELALDGGEVTQARGILGFLQLLPVGRPLDNDELAQLFALQGPIGGPIEHTLDVASSGLKFRSTRVEAAVAREAGAVRLVGVLRGSVLFPAVGSWSTVRLPGPANASAPREATPLDGVGGAPLVRQQRMLDPVGGAMQLGASAGPYRFADAADLFVATNPAWDYAFLETNAACSFLFRRPHLVPAAAEVRTTVPPSFVDIFARSTSKAVYPPLENAIDFPSAAHKLLIVPGGLKLDPVLNVSAPRGDLPLAQHGADQIRLSYDAVTVHYTLDAAGWSLNLTRLRSDADMLGMTRFSRTEYDIVGSASIRPVVQRAQNFLFPDFEDALDFIPGFNEHPNYGPIDLTASNLRHEIKIVTRAEFEKDIDVGEVAVKIGCHVGTWVGWEINTATGLTVPATGVEVGAELQVEIGLEPPWFIVFGLEFAATLKQLTTTGALSTEIEVDAYVGFGAKIKIGPFGGEAFLAVGVVVIWDGIWKVGGLVRLHAELNLEIVTVSIDAELKGVVYCASPNRSCDYSGSVEVNVSICWVFHIDATYEASDTALIGAC